MRAPHVRPAKRTQERKERREKARQWAEERRKYGRTPKGAWVDQQQLEGLAGLGYDRALAAEALRR